MSSIDNDKLTDEHREIISGSLRAHRARVRETQKEAAEAVGVNQTTLCAWENRGGASDVSLWALAGHYGVSLDALLGRPWPRGRGDRMSSVICRIAQGAFFATLAACVALWVAGMHGEARAMLAPTWLLVGVQAGALAYGRRHEGRARR